MFDRANRGSIILIGAGAIVQSAHLPAYRLAGFHVKGIYDLNLSKASQVSETFGIQKRYETFQDALADADDGVVFDVAVPASEMSRILMEIPRDSKVLLQKPMGEDLASAKEIQRICRERNLMAGVNFQLRYAPYILKAKELMAAGALGKITDVEVKLNVYTPWNLWDFLSGIPRMEILYHSIHYIDLARNLLGNPSSISARTIKHPAMNALASVRTNICMHYGEYLWANILSNHCHDFGDKHQHSYLKIEGTSGAILIRIGLLLNYPHGEPDQFEYVSREPGHPNEWTTVPIEGTWFPHAFIGSMSEMMRTVHEPGYIPDNHVNDCLQTMACVEAAYISSESEGIKPEALI